MPSTYTVNLGIEKPATGEQSGTWGDTTNVNFDIIDQAVNGSERVTLTSAGTSGSPNDLNIVNGSTTSSEGRNKWIEIYSASDLGGSAYVRLVPNDAEKILFIRNSLAGSQSVLLFQGTYNASNDLEIPAGVDMVVKFDGAGASATVTDVFTKLRATEITTPTLTAGTADINGGSVDGATVGAASASTGAFTTLTASTSLNIASSTTVDGVLDEDNMASDSATKLATQQSIKAYVDSQVGTVDTLAEILANGNTSGANNLIIDSGQALTANTINETTAGTGVTIDSVLLKDDVVNATDIETSNISANDGTAAATIANSTGNFTITNFISNSVDIGGGAIDGTNIGASSAGTGAFTTLSASGVTTLTGDLAVNTDTLFVDVSEDVTIAGYTEAPYSLNYGYGQFAVVSSNNYSGMSVSAHSDAAINGSYLGFTRSRGTLASPSYVQAGDLIGTATAQPYRLSGGSNRYSDSASMSFVASQTHSASQNGTDITFKSAEDGTITLYERLSLESDLTVFNEDSRDVDFRVESNGSTHMFFVDANTNRVGINQPSPIYRLDILGSNGDQLRLNNGGEQFTQMYFQNNGSNIGAIWADNTANEFEFYAYAGKGATIHSNATERVNFKSSGEVVFNDSGANYDFRVESDNNANMLFVDAGNDRVGVGTAPSYTFHIAGSDPIFSLNDTGANSTRLQLQSTNTAIYYGTIYSSSNPDVIWTVGGATPSAGSEVFRIPAAADAVIFNEASRDQDFRVESDSYTHMFFVDAAENRASIGESTNVPDATLEVKGGITMTSGWDRTMLVAGDSGSGFPVIVWNSQDVGYAGIGYDRTNADTPMKFWTGATSSDVPGTGNFVLELGISGGTSVFNNDSQNIDFRVESDSNANMLFVDAGNESVGIATSATGSTGSLVVQANSGAGAISIIGRSNGGIGTISFYDDDGTSNVGYIQGRADDNQFRVWSTTSDILSLGQNNIERIRLSDSEVVVNEVSRGDNDFRVESDNNTHMLFVDASTDRVGINNSSPNAALTVTGAIRQHGVSNSGALYQLTDNRLYTATQASTNIFQLDGMANDACEVTIIYSDASYRNGSFIQKLYVACTGSGTTVQNPVISVENKARSNNGTFPNYLSWTVTASTSNLIFAATADTNLSGNAVIYIRVVSPATTTLTIL